MVHTQVYMYTSISMWGGGGGGGGGTHKYHIGACHMHARLGYIQLLYQLKQ